MITESPNDVEEIINSWNVWSLRIEDFDIKEEIKKF